MKITVRMQDIEIIIDRPTFVDRKDGQDSTFRNNLMNDTVIPMLNEATEKVKELYKLRNE